MKNKLKREYVRNCLYKHKNDSKKLWREIRQFWPSNKCAAVKVGNICNSDLAADKAEFLNEHFANTGKRLAMAIPQIEDQDVAKFNVALMPPVFEFREMNLTDIYMSIDRLSNSKSSSIDGITSFMVKSCKTSISPILLYLFNLSISTRVFPICWKQEK